MGHYTVISTTPGTLPGGAPYALGDTVERDGVDHLVAQGVLCPSGPPAPDDPAASSDAVAPEQAAETAAAPTPPVRPRRRHTPAKD